MNFEPQKFFIGLIDFFSVLMPGAMLVYLGQGVVLKPFNFESAEDGVVFLFASYLIGHFVFLLGSLMDDVVYDPLRELTEWGQIKRLAKGKRLSPSWLRSLARSFWLFGGNADAAVVQAQRLKASALRRLEAQDAINAYQWSKARLAKDLPEALLAVERFEADSKFFRSFIVVLGVLLITYLMRHQWLDALSCLIGILPAGLRYIDQRFKATQQAYWFIITLEAMETERPLPPVLDDRLTHAGAVIYRRKNEGLQFLLVQASNCRSQWVLPKGHIEPGEMPRMTAVREAREETGAWARCVQWLEDKPISDETNTLLMVRYFLMELAEDSTEWPNESRQKKWLSLAEAQQIATFTETRELLRNAEIQLQDQNKG